MTPYTFNSENLVLVQYPFEVPFEQGRNNNGAGYICSRYGGHLPIPNTTQEVNRLASKYGDAWTAYRWDSGYLRDENEEIVTFNYDGLFVNKAKDSHICVMVFNNAIPKLKFVDCSNKLKVICIV